jgi:hypothetical protein
MTQITTTTKSESVVARIPWSAPKISELEIREIDRYADLEVAFVLTSCSSDHTPN